MAATMSGTDAVKSPTTAAASGSKQQLKSSNSGKALDGARKQATSPVEGQGRKQQPPQPKAWQGTNPITQRQSAIPNGTEKPLPKIPTQSQSKITTEPQADKHAHDRALFLLANFTGHDATLTMKNGEQFTGVFSGGDFESNPKQYVLKMVKRTGGPSHQQANGNGTDTTLNPYTGEGEDHIMVFDKEDTVDLTVSDVVTLAAQPVQNGSINSSFRTDTEISGRDPSMLRQRELQRWEPSADTGMDLSLDDSGETGWDQFAANERMYGVQSTYDEHIYTTVIDRSDPAYKQKEAEAARIAREIEGSTPADAHVAEERRRDADRADALDEEEKYSGVQRQPANLPKRAVGSYVPPSQRPITSGPTVPGAPFDPAIISSQLAKTGPTATSDKPTDAVKAKETDAVTASSAEQKTDFVESSVKASKAVAQPAPIPKKTENTAEDHIRNVTDSFKQFANNEKLRMRQAQEAKRSNARAEKNVKLNDLKKFAANFKLKSRVPDDLVPILAKDREKQMEIQHKADEAFKEEEQRAKDKGIDKLSTDASPAPSSTTSQVGIGAGVEQRLPGNQQSRTRMSQNMGAPTLQTQMQSPRQTLNAGSQANRMYGRTAIQNVSQPMREPRIPTGPAMPPFDKSPLSPGSASRHLNANAPTFEFRPSAGVFTPSGNTPSPQRAGSSRDASSTAADTANFFEKDKPSTGRDKKTQKDMKTFNPIKRKAGEELPEEHKKSIAANGGMPQPYRTQPTWAEHMGVTYKDTFIKSQVQSQNHSPMHTPNVNGGVMPHSHQLPLHMQGGPQVATPSQRQQYLPPPPYQAHPQSFDPRMQHFGPTGSVQSSPRFPQAQMAFNGQMAGGMPMPPFAGGPGQMQGYGLSPSMQHRSVNMGPPGQHGPMMMMPPNQQHGQMPQMPPGYPRGTVQYAPQMMGGQGGPPGSMPMMAQPSAGGFMNGPGMHQQQSYSPMPPHAQPHLPHMQQHGNHPGGYTGSPRPHMMQHSGSHQGYLPTGGHGGPMMPPGPQQQPSPYGGPPGHHQQHPYGMQHRQMSAGGMGYPPMPQMTPRQQHALPNSSGQQQVSPGMLGPGAGPGDEGKP